MCALAGALLALLEPFTGIRDFMAGSLFFLCLAALYGREALRRYTVPNQTINVVNASAQEKEWVESE